METSAFADNCASSTQASISVEYTKTYTIATLRVEIGLGHNNFIYLLYLQNNLLIIIFKLLLLQPSLNIYI